MKTDTLILACVLASTAAFAQEVVITSAPTIEATINSSSSDLSAKLTQILDEAKTQNEKLEQQLKRIGDPSAQNVAAVDMIRQDIISSATSLKTTEQQRTAMSGLTGSEVFEEDAFGVMKPIGATVTKKDGTVVARDPERYRLDAAMSAQVKEYKDVRKAALERKEKLTQELSAVVQDINDAKDLATIQKLDAMIGVLRGQIDECNQTILISQADAEMAEKELVAQARLMSKAAQEEAALNRPPPAAPGTVGGFPKLGTPKRLPWGRKGTDSNAGNDSTRPSAGSGTAGTEGETATP